jgi:hypothetical protein
MSKLEADLTDDFGHLSVRIVLDDNGHVVLWTRNGRKKPMADPADGMMVYGNQIGDNHSGLGREAFADYLEKVAKGLRAIT